MLALFITAIGILLFYNYYWKRRHLPPGPAPLPVIGNVIALHSPSPGYDAFCRWSREYGGSRYDFASIVNYFIAGIYTYWLSELAVVAISDFNLIQETFVKDGDTFAARYKHDEITKIFRGHTRHPDDHASSEA